MKIELGRNQSRGTGVIQGESRAEFFFFSKSKLYKMGKVWVVNRTPHRLVVNDVYCTDTIQGRYKKGSLILTIDPNKKNYIKTGILVKLTMAECAFQKIQVWRDDNKTMIKSWDHDEFCMEKGKELVFRMEDDSITYSFVETA